jgi:predicted type IV restriction endonuclease
MTEQLVKFLDRVKSTVKLRTFDEAATKQAIILPLLQLLGWQTYDIDEVTPEFSVGGRRVDYSLRLSKRNEVFLEVKKPSEDLDKHQEQLLDYSFRQGVELAILTNGTLWWFYLPTKKGDWRERKFYTIHLLEQDTKDITKRLTELLLKSNVQSGEALKYAEVLYKGRIRNSTVKETLPDAWNRTLSEPDPSLVDLLVQVTEKICGYKAEPQEVRDFLNQNQDHLLLRPEPLTQGRITSEKGRNFLGHKIGSQAAQIDDLLLKGITVDEAAKVIGSTISRVRSHIRHLRNAKGVEVIRDGPIRKLILPPKT